MKAVTLRGRDANRLLEAGLAGIDIYVKEAGGGRRASPPRQGGSHPVRASQAVSARRNRRGGMACAENKSAMR